MGVVSSTSVAPALRRRPLLKNKDVMAAAFWWLAAFFVVYCARPEDWIPGLKYLPLAKITGFGAMAALFLTFNRSKRKVRELPIEARYLVALIVLLILSGLLSPVWKTGALLHTFDFAKISVIWILLLLVIEKFSELKKLIYIQAASVAVISAVSLVKGRNHPRLEGVIGGIYSNANDLAFAIVLALPFCLAFLLSSKSMFRKLLWLGGIFIMLAALFLTASRAGFVDLVVSGVVCLWHFGVKGKRLYLIVAATVTVVVLGATLGGKLAERFNAISTEQSGEAYDSYVLRGELMKESLTVIEHYPILGIGVANFKVYFGTNIGSWLEVHNAYLLIAAEGGIPAFIFYMLFFGRGFRNLRLLRRMGDLEPEVRLFVGAMHTSLVGFAVGALFGPESYHFFSYFAVAYTSTMLLIVTEQRSVDAADDSSPLRSSRALTLYTRSARA